MKNPWIEPEFVEDTYVLQEDWNSVRAHNARVGANQTKLVCQSIPEPYIGNPELATVVLLGKNPGHSDKDRESHQDPAFRDAMFKNLRHELDEYPFYPLNPDPRFSSSGAGKWWRKRTKHLLQAGVTEAELGKKLMVIEWLPYHSKTFARPKAGCPSQAYSFHLAKRMLEKNKLVVRMRARAEWVEVSGEFAKLPSLRNPQCGHISRRNTDPALFAQIVAALKS